MPIKYAVPAGSARSKLFTALAARYTGGECSGRDGLDGLDTHLASQTSDRFGYSIGKTRKYSKAYEIFLDRIVVLLTRGQRQQAVNQEQQDEKNLENETFRKELYDLGAAIIYAMHKESSEHGAVFVLVTHIKELYEASLNKDILSMDVSEPLSNPSFSLPDNLEHINESGNGVLAWEIAKFLQTNQLIPVEHLNTQSPSRAYRAQLDFSHQR